MPIGSAFHERTLPLCESLNYRDWAGYYAVSAYETHHEHEYNAIRNAAALIDVSPLFKYIITGRDATQAGRPADHPRCHEAGRRTGDLHALVRRAGQGDRRRDGVAAGRAALSLDRGRSEPALVRAERRRARRVRSRTCRKTVAALAVQGPTSGALLRRVRGCRRRVAQVFPRDERQHRRRAGRYLAHRIHRRPRLRNLDAVGSGDARVGRDRRGGGPFDLRPAGMLALDVARIEAGLLLIEVDFFSSRKALIPEPAVLALRDGAGPARAAREGAVRRAGRAAEGKGERTCAPDCRPRDRVGRKWRRCTRSSQLPPQVPATASRVAVPVYRDGAQVGKATSTTWSPVLKKMIALATVESGLGGGREPGLQMEVTVEAVRHRVGATVVQTPFFNPPRKPP